MASQKKKKKKKKKTKRKQPKPKRPKPKQPKPKQPKPKQPKQPKQPKSTRVTLRKLADQLEANIELEGGKRFYKLIDDVRRALKPSLAHPMATAIDNLTYAVEGCKPNKYGVGLRTKLIAALRAFAAGEPVKLNPNRSAGW